MISSNPEINAQIEWLIAQGYPALPIAPEQDPERYPRIVKNKIIEGESRYSGKNPSYLDQWGNPQPLNHTPYQHRLPTTRELKSWFVHPRTGIATMGGWNNTVWIDVDCHHFESVEACWAVMNQYLRHVPQLRKTYVEVTQRGGLHIAVRVPTLPSFTNFALEPGGRHLGELLCTGRIVVLAPTHGSDGRYQILRRNPPVTVESLDDLSIYPIQKKGKPAGIQSVVTPPISPRGSINLNALVCRRVKQMIEQLDSVQVGDRSTVLCAIAHEAFGWENWLHQQGLVPNPSAEAICYAAGIQMGIDEGRISRILNSKSSQIPIRCSLPAVHYYGGDKLCWQLLTRYQFGDFAKPL